MAFSGVFTFGPLRRPCPHREKNLGHLGHALPLWFLAIVILNLNYLLQVDHFMYRLKYPLGLAIYYYHLLLFIVIVGLMLHSFNF